MSDVSQSTIKGGVYLVIDPSMEQELLLDKLNAAINGGIAVVQIWNNWHEKTDKLLFIQAIAKLCKPFNIPVLINEEWHLLMQTTGLNGVHFDQVPSDINAIKKAVNRPFFIGITCSGDLETVRWADKHRLDYISFCAMFPSQSAGTCNIVAPEMILQANKLTSIPLFVSGGMTPDNTLTLTKQIPFQGVAVISGILNAQNPTEQVKNYQHALKLKTK